MLPAQLAAAESPVFLKCFISPPSACSDPLSSLIKCNVPSCLCVRYRTHSTYSRSNLNELCCALPPHSHRNYSAQWVLAVIVLISDFTNSRDGGARGGLACLWRRWFLSILRTISALKGETSPFTEHLFPRTGVKSKLGVTDRKSAKDTASIWHRTPPPSFSRYEFMDYGDVVMPRRLNCRRSPRLNHPS